MFEGKTMRVDRVESWMDIATGSPSEMVVLKSVGTNDQVSVETFITIIDPGQRGRFEVGEEYGLFLVPSGDDSLEVSVEVDVKVEIDGEPLQETATPETKFHCCHCTKEAD